VISIHTYGQVAQSGFDCPIKLDSTTGHATCDIAGTLDLNVEYAVTALPTYPGPRYRRTAIAALMASPGAQSPSEARKLREPSRRARSARLRHDLGQGRRLQDRGRFGTKLSEPGKTGLAPGWQLGLS
jgi:hypothetical protein